MIEQRTGGKPDHAPDVIQREPLRHTCDAADGHVVAVNPRAVERNRGSGKASSEQMSNDD